MNSWRITKFNPVYRSIDGNYFDDDWTSIYDIGKFFKGNELTLESYLFYENSYIKTVKMIMNSNNVDTLTIKSLEKYEYADFSDLSINNAKKHYNLLHNDLQISILDIDLTIRLILREMIWCKLINNNAFVHFGYDFYMYIGRVVLFKKIQDAIIENKLFIEEMPSPYGLAIME